VHNEAKRFADKGFTVVFIGHQGHDEAVGVMGETGTMGVLVEDLADLEALVVKDPEKVVYLTQTTLGVTDTAGMIARLKERFPAIKSPPKQDICYATENRQVAVGSAAAEADLVLVVGSRNSSNSNRLVDEARRLGTDAHLIDGPGDLEDAWFADVGTVVLTAGASVPEPVVQSVLDWLVDRFPVDIEERTTATENVVFRLPQAVR
jgi:4-hydroxy-3-methylbut-2-enyl diphosphate reductase